MTLSHGTSDLGNRLAHANNSVELSTYPLCQARSFTLWIFVYAFDESNAVHQTKMWLQICFGEALYHSGQLAAEIPLCASFTPNLLGKARCGCR